MNELVARLTKGLHPIVAERSASARELREQIDRGFVLLKFPNTRGGTELGSQLDLKETRLDGADFERGTGNVRLVGNLTLNYDKVQLVADIDLASLKGTGQLVLVEEAGGSQGRNGNGATNGSAAANGNGNGHGNGHGNGTAVAAENEPAEAGDEAKAVKAGAKKNGRGTKVA